MTPSEFLEKWSSSAAAERSNAQPFVIDLCAVLNVDPPNAATSDADRDAYVFEKPVTVAHEGRQQSIGFIDLFKRGHFSSKRSRVRRPVPCPYVSIPPSRHTNKIIPDTTPRTCIQLRSVIEPG